MAQFIPFAPNVEVHGKTVLLLIDTMGHFKRFAMQVLAKYGITEICEDGWFPQAAYLEVHKEFYTQVGPRTLKIIGKEVPGKVLWPPKIQTIEAALQSIDVAYRMNHRGGEIGSYQFESTGTRTATMVCHNPYPCPFDYGIIEGTAMKFAPKNARVVVKHDDAQPCRMNGGETCAYQISW